MMQTTTEPKPPHLGILPVTIELLGHIFNLSEGYSIVGVTYDAYHRILNFTLNADALPEAQEGTELPRLNLLYRVETLPDQPREYRKITTEVTIQGGQKV